jgi:hypothetical protein
MSCIGGLFLLEEKRDHLFIEADAEDLVESKTIGIKISLSTDQNKSHRGTFYL